MTEDALRRALCRTGRTLVRRGLVHGTTGNLSVRLADGFLVTPTNSALGALRPDRLSRLDADGRHLDGDPPSKEAFLHVSTYAVRPEAGAIVHTHSTHSVAVSILERPPGAPVLPPLTAYQIMRVGEIAFVPYFRPGDEALALAVREAASGAATVLLANHGPVVAGRTLDDAVHALEELEATAKLHLLTQDRHVRVLTPEQVAELTGSASDRR